MATVGLGTALVRVAVVRVEGGRVESIESLAACRLTLRSVADAVGCSIVLVIASRVGSVDVAVFSSVEPEGEDAVASESSTFSVVVVLIGTLPTTERELLARRASMMVAEALSASELYCHAEELTFLLSVTN